jgi:hypothetical protein
MHNFSEANLHNTHGLHVLLLSKLIDVPQMACAYDEITVIVCPTDRH